MTNIYTQTQPRRGVASHCLRLCCGLWAFISLLFLSNVAFAQFNGLSGVGYGVIYTTYGQQTSGLGNIYAYPLGTSSVTVTQDFWVSGFNTSVNLTNPILFWTTNSSSIPTINGAGWNQITGSVTSGSQGGLDNDRVTFTIPVGSGAGQVPVGTDIMFYIRAEFGGQTRYSHVNTSGFPTAAPSVQADMYKMRFSADAIFIDGNTSDWNLNSQICDRSSAATGRTLNVTWDDTYVYVLVNGGFTASSSDRVLLGFDVNPNSGGNANGTKAAFNGAYFPENYRPDVIYRARGTGSNTWANDKGVSNGSNGWTYTGSIANGTEISTASGSNTSNLEFRISRSSIGSFTSLGLFVWLGTSSDDIYDAFPFGNPNAYSSSDLFLPIQIGFSSLTTGVAPNTVSYFDGQYEQSGGFGMFGISTYRNLTVNASGNTIYSPSAALTINGNLAVSAGTFEFTGSSSHTVKGNVNIASGTTLTLSATSGGDLNVGGNWTRGGTLNTNTRSVTFNGTAAQIIYNNTTFQALNINNPTYVQINDDMQATTCELLSGSTFKLNSKTLTILNSGLRQLTINSGATFEAGTGRINFDGQGTFTNYGTFDRGTSTVEFKGGETTLAGNVALNFHNIIITGRCDFSGTGARGRLSGTMEIGASGFVPNAPVYETGSTLSYNCGCSYDRKTEWDDNSVYNVTVTNGSTLNLGSQDPTSARTMLGNLNVTNGTLTMNAQSATFTVGGDVTVASGQSLVLSSASGGDLEIKGNLVVNSTGFNTNRRAVRFSGTGSQSISGTQQPIFSYVEMLKSSGTLTLQRSITLNHPDNSVAVMTLNGAGIFDLNDQTVQRDASDAGTLLRLVNGTLRTNGTVINTATGVGFTRYNATATVSDETDTKTVGGKVDYSGSIAENVEALTYNKLSLSGSSSKNLSSNITVNDSLWIESSATADFGATASVLDGKGYVKIGGTATGSSSGKIRLSGSAAQTLAATGTVRNIDLSNSNGATLSGKLTVNNALTISAGDLTTGSADTVVLASAATISENIDFTTTTGADNYLIGNLKTVRSVGTAAETFGGMGFSLTAGADLGTVTAIRVSGANGMITSNGNTSINRKWVVTPTVQPATADRNVTFTWPSDDDNAKSLTAFQMWKSPDGVQPYEKFGLEQNVNTHPRSVTVNNIASFSTFTGTDSNQPLPVELLSFDGRNVNGDAYLYWTTLSERNNKGFFIEKSSDSVHFYEIGFVAGKGTSSDVNFYSFTDKQFTADSYYRLKQMDMDGNFEYSKKVFVQTNKSSIEVGVFPNPFAHNIQFALNQNVARVKLSVYSLEGKLIGAFDGSVSDGNQYLNTQTEALSKGVYLVRFQAEGLNKTVKIAKQ